MDDIVKIIQKPLGSYTSLKNMFEAKYVTEAMMHSASDEFLKVLKQSHNTSAHKWAKKSSKSGDWDLTKANGFTQELFMGDIVGAWSRTRRKDEELVLEEFFEF